MSDNPRLWLAAFWMLLWLETIADANWHSPYGAGIALVGLITCPVCAYFEARQGIRDHRKSVKR
jgi:hypothetical protein